MPNIKPKIISNLKALLEKLLFIASMKANVLKLAVHMKHRASETLFINSLYTFFNENQVKIKML